jgi:hypothetical protein
MRKLATIAASLLTLIAAPGAAWADPTGAKCVGANEHATDLRQKDKLREARAEMLTCALPECPGRVRDDCVKQIAEIDASMPTIVFEVKDPAGNDRSDVRLLVDGAVFAERLTGSALSFDPGEREVRFEAPGAEPVVKRLVVHAGEKNRAVAIVLGPPAPAGDASRTGGDAHPAVADGDVAPSGHGRRVLALVAGGLGVIGLGVGAGLGLASRSSWSQSQADCRTPVACASYSQAVNERSSAYTLATASDVAFVAGGAVLVAAAVLFFTAPSAPSAQSASPRASAAASPSLLPEVGPHAGGLVLRGLF